MSTDAYLLVGIVAAVNGWLLFRLRRAAARCLFTPYEAQSLPPFPYERVWFE